MGYVHGNKFLYSIFILVMNFYFFAESNLVSSVARFDRQRIFSMHGGIPKVLDNFDEIRGIGHLIYGIPEDGIVCDLLWSDPSSENDGKIFLMGPLLPSGNFILHFLCFSRLGIQ